MTSFAAKNVASTNISDLNPISFLPLESRIIEILLYFILH